MTYAEARAQLVQHLRRAGVSDERVLSAIGRVPRERFLPPDLAGVAYEDTSLPIGWQQTISQPLVVATMTEALRLSGSERVLEIGTGSGYQAAVLAELAADVVTVERVPELYERAAGLLAALRYTNVRVHQAGDELGWPADGPYDRIIVTAAGPELPSSLLAQLTVGGLLVMPVGTLTEQRLQVATRTERGVDVRDLGRVRFVPLIGRGAWPYDAEVVTRAPAEQEWTDLG